MNKGTTIRAGARWGMAAAFVAALGGCAGSEAQGGGAFGADAAGVVAAGPTPVPFQCAGFVNWQCPVGAADPAEPTYVCIDDTRDDCDPLGGGADCSGLCVREKPQRCGGPADLPCGLNELCLEGRYVPHGGGVVSASLCVLVDPASTCDPTQAECPAPPPDCHYEGGGCVDGVPTCGALVCKGPTGAD